MSMLQKLTPEPRLWATSGTWGEAEIVGSSRGVLVSLSGRNYDTFGHQRISSALASLTPAEARRLAHLLREASAVADIATPDHRVWSDATVADVAAHLDRRAAQ